MVDSPSHQTIKLSAGRHRRAEHGACVMELASMLAGGPFSDHPQSVCPVIAAFLRSYNDHVDHERRKDLYRYAARVAGTRADAEVERRRSKMCLTWARACCDRPELRVRILHRLLRSLQGPDVHAVYAARAAVVTPGGHKRALAFLDELIELSTDPGSRHRRSGRVATGASRYSLSCRHLSERPKPRKRRSEVVGRECRFGLHARAPRRRSTSAKLMHSRGQAGADHAGAVITSSPPTTTAFPRSSSSRTSRL